MSFTCLKYYRFTFFPASPTREITVTSRTTCRNLCLCQRFRRIFHFYFYIFQTLLRVVVLVVIFFFGIVCHTKNRPMSKAHWKYTQHWVFQHDHGERDKYYYSNTLSWTTGVSNITLKWTDDFHRYIFAYQLDRLLTVRQTFSRGESNTYITYTRTYIIMWRVRVDRVHRIRYDNDRRNG